ncbi:MAG: hypothetical protein KJP07_07765, partial [Desulfatitalea sp.]|nr:hypothetical protein [Desulfatitalea sp.]
KAPKALSTGVLEGVRCIRRRVHLSIEDRKIEKLRVERVLNVRYSKSPDQLTQVEVEDYCRLPIYNQKYPARIFRMI